MEMGNRAGVPAPPVRPQLPIGEPVVVRMGGGVREFDTDFGKRPTFGIHVYNYLEGDVGGNVGYHGHVNVFWEAVRAQLGMALVGSDTLMACRVLRNGRRYELDGLEEAIETDILQKVEALIADNDPAREWVPGREDEEAPF